MGHIATYIVEMSSKSNLKNVAQQPDILLSVRTQTIILFSCLYENSSSMSSLISFRSAAC